jgi:hypothetical protein
VVTLDSMKVFGRAAAQLTTMEVLPLPEGPITNNHTGSPGKYWAWHAARTHRSASISGSWKYLRMWFKRVFHLESCVNWIVSVGILAGSGIFSPRIDLGNPLGEGYPSLESVTEWHRVSGRIPRVVYQNGGNMTEQLMKAIQGKLRRVRQNISGRMYFGHVNGYLGEQGCWILPNGECEILSPEEWDALNINAIADINRCSKEVYLEWRGMKDSWL